MHRSLSWFGVALVALLTAAFTRHEPRRPYPTKPPPENEAAPCFQRTDGSGDLAVTWSETAATRSCFFFSGPGELGRDDPLGEGAHWWRGDEEQSFELGAARFDGPIGDATVARRVSSHTYAGHTWRVVEAIEGSWSTVVGEERKSCDVFEGSYRYEECDTQDSRNCPSPCVIEAHLIAR